MGSTLVSVCRCCMLVSCVHPVAVRSAEFWTVWSLLWFVSAMMGDQIVLAYSIRGSVVALYVVTIVSFDFPQCVVVSALSILLDCLALVIVFCVCFVNVSFGSHVRPRILGFFTVGRTE